jgi:hypothetical protein
MLATIPFRILSSHFLPKKMQIKRYISIILPLLYGCETLSLTVREEQRLRVFENRMLKRISGHKRKEVVGSWMKLHNDGLHNLYTSPNIIRVIKYGM